jgi:hypothetical protein
MAWRKYLKGYFFYFFVGVGSDKMRGIMLCLDATFVTGIWGKAIISNFIRHKFWVWLQQDKEKPFKFLPEFVGGICEAKILATNSTSRGVIYQFRIFDASISLIYQIFLFLTDPQTLPHLVVSPLTKSSPSHRCPLFSHTHLKQVLSLMKNFSQLIPMAITYFFATVETPFSL